MPEFTRPHDGLRFTYGGLRTSQVADAMPPAKYPVGINVRSYKQSSVQTRPGQSLRLATSAAQAITDIGTYAALSTDNKPRILVRDATDKIWLSPTSGTVAVAVGTGLLGSGASRGASMIPFRPNASPTPYMYIANGSDYQKFSAPNVDVVTQANVGIAEPPSAPDAAILPVLNTAAGPSSETLRPTAYTNPTPVAGLGGEAAYVNPGDAIDGSDVTYAYGTVENGPANNAASCLWSGFPAASLTYLALTLTIDIEGVLASGAMQGSIINYVDYSLDNGATWINAAVFSDTFPRQNVTITLAPTTDLTMVQVRVWGYGFLIAPNFGVVQPRVYDIRTEGDSATSFFDQTGVAASWTAGGTAAAPANVNGPGDTALAVIPDPLNPHIYSIAFQLNTSPPAAWGVGVTMTQGANKYLLLDVMQPGISATIAAIYYFNGASGRCIIVPNNLPVATVPDFQGNNPQAGSFLAPSAIASLRRGAMLKLNNTEYVYVYSVTVGPDNTLCIETSTAGTYVAGQTLTAGPTMVVYGSATPTTGGTDLNENWLSSAVTTGEGTLTRTVNFFSTISSTTGLQDDDYLHISMAVDIPANLTEVLFEFDVGDGSFTQDYFYYVLRPSDLSQMLAGSETQLAAAQTLAQRAMIDALDPTAAGNRGPTDSGAQLAPGAIQRTEIMFPIRALTRVGQGIQTLVNATKVRITVRCTGNVTIYWGATSTWGGSQPDVGLQGAPYFYRVRPRSKLTGVIGNPSPSTRYGLNPLRFSVLLSLPSTAYDPQIDTWDVFRYGGSVLSWRYIGSTASGNQTFTDNYGDDSALAGDELTFDEFQPWPSIDLPNNGTTLEVTGTIARVTSSNANILKYLPGTLVQLGGQNVYTLQTRPTLISGTTYLLQFIENVGALTFVPFNIQEPVLAQQRLPYMWGPDAGGTVFACGDPLRPGTLSFSKNYAPDSAPDSYNLEIVEPAEPLLGGEILDGLSFVGTPERWWALYPTPDNPAQRYNPVQQPFPRGLAAPFGHCNDGQSLYWWAKDGIQSSTKGSLTDADLYNLFPHEGVEGKTVTYGGYTFSPPDYKRAGTFRLGFANSYLYALYQDSAGAYHSLVLDTRSGAWAEDRYSPVVCSIFHPSQQAGTVQTNATRYDELLMGTINGKVAAQVDASNDLEAPIACAISTFEYQGEDSRAPKQWGDVYVDVTPASLAGLTVRPFSGGAGVAPAVVIPQSARVQTSMSVGGIVVSQFLGLLATWTDDFSTQSSPTELHLWQPSFAVQPAKTLAFTTFGTSYGVSGFMHIQQLAIAYVSTAPITLTITSYDGTSPAPLVLPSTAGAYEKVIFQLTANKGQLYRFAWSSAAEFQVFLDDCEIHVGAWGRQGPYMVRKDMGGSVDAAAAI